LLCVGTGLKIGLGGGSGCSFHDIVRRYKVSLGGLLKGGFVIITGKWFEVA